MKVIDFCMLIELNVLNLAQIYSTLYTSKLLDLLDQRGLNLFLLKFASLSNDQSPAKIHYSQK
jgi:hypothetical protein